MGQPWKIHGMSHTPTYYSWKTMIQRCHNPKTRDYKRYGARGIFVCTEWRRSFARFLKEMGVRPEGTTLDRIDNNGPYRRDNCRWASTAQQHANTRQNRRIRIRERNLTLAEWTREKGYGRSLIKGRLLKGWDPVVAVETPPGGIRRNTISITHKGKTQNVRQWARELGIGYGLLSGRLRSGWRFDDAIKKPSLKTTPLITINGVSKPMKEWLKTLNMCRDTVQYRMKVYGWSVQQALTAPKHLPGFRSRSS